MQMLSCTLGALALVALAAAQSGQTPLSLETSQLETHVPGLNLDLDELRLVQFSLDSEPEWITEREKLQAKIMGRDCMDITDTPLLGTISEKPHFSYPPPNSTVVAGVLSHLSKNEAKANLEHFSSYHTRWCYTETGRASSEWLFSKILAYTAELASDEQRQLISVESVKHSWKQNSIIISISPPHALRSAPITVLGAHIDSVNRKDPLGGRAPGADDDGSGTVTILEAYRALLVAGYIPTSPLEFHFYAGEEAGLLGSQAIVSRYETAGKVIRGMIQIDTVLFHKAGTREEIGVISNENQVDATLTKFLTQVIDRYLDIPWAKTIYPSGPTGPNPSSDHASWTKAKYQACQVLEGQFNNSNPHLHGPDDRIDTSPENSFDHLLQFAKLAVGFAIEMSSY
ncbi:Peptide hydrolase [Mycena venus]|uniref:Peptide hydrolase n=1 Tax=Mycena venus TaxID=2733690 RepID=A0A8H6WXM7_9AGAR|nr:Peptide hydrolase [Mycena venus]